MCICQISETEPKSNEFKLQPGNTILGGDLYDARKKDIQYTDELDCLFTTVCLNNETYDCSYAADENYREWIFIKVRLFWEGHKNQEGDNSKFCGLLRKAELYLTYTVANVSPFFFESV